MLNQRLTREARRGPWSSHAGDAVVAVAGDVEPGAGVDEGGVPALEHAPGVLERAPQRVQRVALRVGRRRHGGRRQHRRRNHQSRSRSRRPGHRAGWLGFRLREEAAKVGKVAKQGEWRGSGSEE